MVNGFNILDLRSSVAAIAAAAAANAAA